MAQRGLGGEGLIFVNTQYNCLAALSERHSFKSLWQPPFISKLAPEDRCHLNGLALRDGQPRYVTAVSRSDVVDGWRDKRRDGGVVIDTQSNEILLEGLSMPHSPRYYRGKLWLLNSGAGEFGYVDLERGRFEPVVFCPGYARGLAFWGDYAIVGLSKPREKTFSSLELDERLEAKQSEARCGLLVIDLNNGHIAHWLRLEGVVTELYDVQVLPGVRRPMALGFKTNEIAKLVTVEPRQVASATPPPVKKVIAFSLWGDNPKYTAGALKNAELAPNIYPGWICRFYVDDSVPAGVVAALAKHDHVEIVKIDQKKRWGGPFWRFYPAAAADVEVLIVRDTDSRLNQRERAAVEEWLAGDKACHIMRDHPRHALPIMAGLWGVKGDKLKNIVQLVAEYLDHNDASTFGYGIDQKFLAEIIYPLIEDDCLVHDEIFKGQPFPTPRAGSDFVGQIFSEDDEPLAAAADMLREFLAAQANDQTAAFLARYPETAWPKMESSKPSCEAPAARTEEPTLAESRPHREAEAERPTPLADLPPPGQPIDKRSAKKAAKFFNKAATLQKRELLAEATESYFKGLALNPDHVEALIALGKLLPELEQPQAAITALRRAVAIAPDSAKVHFNLAKILKKEDQLKEAAAHFRQTTELRPDFVPGHNNLGTTLQSLGYLDEAAACYKQVIKLDPNIAEPQANLAAVWQARGQVKRAESGFRRALRLKPDYVPAHFNLATLYQRQGRMEAALATFQQVLALEPAHLEAHFNLAQIYEIQGQAELAHAAYQQAIKQNPKAPHYFYYLEHNRVKLCDWIDYDRRLANFIARVEAHIADEAAPTLVPLNLSAVPTPPALHGRVARHMAGSISRGVAQQRGFTPEQIEAGQVTPAFDHPKIHPDRLRIGYLSPDFRNHAVGRLIHRLFEQHDRDRFQIYGYSLLGVEDEYTRHIQAGCDLFRQFYRRPAAEAAQQIYRDGIHILVDLAGYTAYANSDILAYRPAPIQAHFMGYPDTMGADFIDYALVDQWLVTPELAEHYAETPFYLSHAFAGSPAEISERPMNRAEFGLPADSPVFCCFNSHYKIDPQLFSVWMNILKALPGSVLWLSTASETIRRNLANEAAARGVDPQRLRYAERLPEAEYLARYQLVDLFLDTFHYNAGSTAVAALWAGLPLLTRVGQTNSARMGASICAAAGLTETICHSSDEYEAKAIHLTSHPAELIALRRQLVERRQTAPLFDLAGLARSLEEAYREMWARYAGSL